MPRAYLDRFLTTTEPSQGIEKQKDPKGFRNPLGLKEVDDGGEHPGSQNAVMDTPSTARVITQAFLPDLTSVPTSLIGIRIAPVPCGSALTNSLSQESMV